jgi:hypothetical protein
MVMKSLILLVSLMLSALCFTTAKAESEKYERVGGTYQVSKIDQRDDGTFVIEFESVQKTGKFDVIKLESDHVHASVTVGEKLRLSAEIISTKGKRAEASQVLIFVPNIQGHMPVWMLSRKAKNMDLQGSKFIEMHAPQSDYTIL